MVRVAACPQTPRAPGGGGASPSVSRPLRPSGFEMRSRKQMTGDRRWRKAARPSQLLLRDPQDLGEGPAADLLPLMAAQVPTREMRTPRKDPRTRRAPCHVWGTVARGRSPAGKRVLTEQVWGWGRLVGVTGEPGAAPPAVCVSRTCRALSPPPSVRTALDPRRRAPPVPHSGLARALGPSNPRTRESLTRSSTVFA